MLVMLPVEMLPLRAIVDCLVAIGNGDKLKLTQIMTASPSEIAAPMIQAGSTPCPLISRYSYAEVVTVEAVDALVTRTGAVVINDRFVVEETVEGSLEDNCFKKENGSYYLDWDVSVEFSNLTTFCKFGVFNHSIYLTEILPCAYLLSLSRPAADQKFVFEMPDFMSSDAQKLRWATLSAFGYRKENAVAFAGSACRVKKLVFSKVTDRYKNHRSSLILPPLAGHLKFLLADSSAVSPKAVYIHRNGRSGARKVRNLDQLHSLLHRYSVTSVDLENLSFSEQVNLFSKVDVVLGEHGAGLVNTMFMRPSSTVIEIFPSALVGRWAFRLMAHTFKLRYCFGSFPVAADWKWNADPVDLDIDAIENILLLVQNAV